MVNARKPERLAQLLGGKGSHLTARSPHSLKSKYSPRDTPQNYEIERFLASMTEAAGSDFASPLSKWKAGLHTGIQLS